MVAQHGVVATAQMEAIGYSRPAIARRVADHWLRPVHRGVYTTSHTPLRFVGHCMAAVLACGPDALVSHHAAFALWELRPTPQGRIDVTAPVRRRHAGVRCHVSAVPAVDRAEIDGIPVTALARTALDYAESSSPRQLRAALEAGQRRLMLDARAFDLVIARNHGRRGLRPLRLALAELIDEPPWTQSELEERFRELLLGSGLPMPSFNVPVAGSLVDCAWVAQRLIVELDGFAFHRGRASFEDDRRRDRALAVAGWRVVRITYRQIVEQPERVIDDLRRLLAG